MTACGGGEDEPATAPAAYAGSFAGAEGSYDNSFNSTQTGTATLVLAANGTLTYKGVAYTPTSVFVDKTAGAMGRLLYVMAGNGHFDIAETPDPTLGSAWGTSPADGAIFRDGVKQ